jgi:RNA polymerase sigma factor (sigma-70 family)
MDAQLVALALAGDARAFGALVTRYQEIAVAVAYAATGDLALSEDLAQEALVVAWRRLPTLSEPDRFGPWLCGIVRHVARSDRRHRSRHAPAGGELPDALASGQPSPLDEVMARQTLARTWQALRRLPSRYREPLVLYCRLDHSHARVAASLGLSEEAVRQRVSRARQKLRAEVEGVDRSVAAAPRRPLAAAVIALIWARRARTASAAVPLVAAPIAALAAIVVLVSGALTAARATTNAAQSTPAAIATGDRPLAVADDEPAAVVEVEEVRATVALGAGTVRARQRPIAGRVVRHGPAVVVPPRPLERPTVDLDMGTFLP